MNGTDYAVLFRKEIVSLDYNTSIFKPLTILEGIANYENQTFIDKLNVERSIFTDSELILSHINECVGYVMTKEELLKLYPAAKNITEAKKLFNNELLECMIIGIYDKNNDKVKILKFNLKEMSNTLDNKDDFQVSKVDKKNRDNISDKQTESQYEKMKKSLNNQELTVIEMSTIEYLVSLDNLDDIKNIILEVKNNKDEYEELLRCKEKVSCIIPDYSINEFLKINDINVVKEKLNNVINSYNEIQLYEEENPITPEEFIESYSEDYRKIMGLKNIKLLKSHIKESIINYKMAFQELEMFEEYDIELSKKFIEDEIKTLEEILKMQNLEDAKEIYNALYIRNQTIIEAVANELTKYETYFDNMEEVQNEVAVKSAKISAEEIINRAKKSINELNDLIGLENVKKVFEDLVKEIIYREKIKDIAEVPTLNLNMVFKGNPGTGKTTVARIISKLLCDLGYLKSNKVKECTAKDFIGQYVGHTAPKASAIINANKGGVIFIDEAYVFAGPAQQFAQEALAEIMKELETNRTAFIFAGYSKEMEDFVKLNSGLESRIGYNMDFSDYTEEQLYQMLENKFKKNKFKLDLNIKEDIMKIIHDAKNSKNFGNGRFIDNLYMKIYLSHVSNAYTSDDLEELVTISAKDITSDLIETPKMKKFGFYQ